MGEKKDKKRKADQEDDVEMGDVIEKVFGSALWRELLPELAHPTAV